MTLQEWKDAAKAGKVYLKQVNQREQIVRRKVLAITRMDEQGRLFVFTNLSPACVYPDKLELRK